MIASNPLWIVLVSSAEKKAYVSGRGDPTEDGICLCEASTGDHCEFSDAVHCLGHGVAHMDGTCCL